MFLIYTLRAGIANSFYKILLPGLTSSHIEIIGFNMQYSHST